MKIDAAIPENSIEGSQKMKIELPYDTVPFLNVYTKKKKKKAVILKDICALLFTAALFTVDKT